MKMTRHKRVFLFFFFIFCVGNLSSDRLFGKEPLKIRVAVFRGIPEVILAVAGPFEIVDARTQVSLYRGKDLSPAKVTVTPEGLKLKGMVFTTDAFTCLPKKQAAITVNNRHYRGDVSIFKDEGGSILIVNILDLESYIKGVLYHEISHRWPMDAIKAQAVAARTYAVYQKEAMKLKDYDLTADTSSQVYGGYESEKRKTNRAVNFTYGEILRYQGRVFPAYFHATCGGVTENASELWKIDIVPLKGERACSFCLESPHYYWKAPADLKTIQKKMGARYALGGVLKNISVAERNSTGRVRTLELKDEQGASLIISAKDFRAIQGSDVIRSTNFTILLDEGRATFVGKGWGHGVGLCQWGALGMSKKGYTYKQILEFYYPGSEIVKI
jgi:stage II sporulation protein D